MLSQAAVQQWTTGVVYIVLFGAGSMAGMALLAALIAVPLRWSDPSPGGMHRGITAVVGLCSCALGARMVWSLGVAGGLLPIGPQEPARHATCGHDIVRHAHRFAWSIVVVIRVELESA